MAVNGARKIELTFSGDVTGTFVIPADDNTGSPGVIEVKTLAAGANTITVPTGGTTAKAVTIVPPASNVESITFKGVSGDTGVRLHDTDPSTITLHSTVSTFVLTAGDTVTGVRLYWS